MSFTDQPAASPGRIPELNDHYLGDERTLVLELAQAADSGAATRKKIEATALRLVEAVRRNSASDGGIDAFLQQYDLSSEEGVLLMCIAEALLRIPDADTADRLIADKITAAKWQDHLGASDSLFVNASTWGLMLTGKVLQLDAGTRQNPMHLLGKLANRAGEPVVRTAMRQAMRIMGHQFVMGRSIDEALKRSLKGDNRRYRYSFDMLGEAALIETDAARYFESYHEAISRIGAAAGDSTDIFSAPGISVKLSALHPKFNFMNQAVVVKELVPRLLELAVHARENGIGLTVDAEEADRLELSLEVFDRVFKDGSLAGYEGFGLAVQTFQRRARNVFRYLTELSADCARRIPVRLVKGAYWDAEIKHAQELGHDSFPVFTRKVHTDVSYLACARQVLDAGESIYPQFATHNAHTLSSILHFAGSRTDYEFQRLHGMGEELYAEVIDPERFGRPCRVYAPVGSHEDLLPYLVRRLLENGSNTSFVNRILDESVAIEDIVNDPLTAVLAHDGEPHPQISPAADLFQPERANSRGYNLADHNATSALLSEMALRSTTAYEACPLVNGSPLDGPVEESVNPAQVAEVVGTVRQADEAAVDQAIDCAAEAQPGWDLTPASDRARCLGRAADLFEEHGAELMALCIREAGKTLPDAVSELREAVDFLRYYAAQAEQLFGEPREMPGPTGELNTLGLRGRGVFVCISPWNFPLAIFTGQVAAALAAGNAVIAKPAEQTPLVAFRAVQLLLEAGIPASVLHFLPGEGAQVGARAVADPRVAGVAFTGSTETARVINLSLAKRDGPIATFIAETGGQNAMFVDSSALPEQVVQDSVFSAFNSAGQRCSALRLLCVQEEVAPRVTELLIGQMQLLDVGDPTRLSTDVGPAIDADARAILEAHVARMTKEAKLVYQCELSAGCSAGTFFPPALIALDSIDVLEREVFGPVLHLCTFKSGGLEGMVESINNLGYGLTMGIHTRIDARARALAKRSCAGNIYVNRNMIGAVVGVQPFGGRGLSGTGPKAGGPHYLLRFASEYTVSTNLAAVGGNASLLSLGSE